MNKLKLLLLSSILCAGLSHAAPSLEEVVTSPETFAVCKTVDVLSTMYIINSGIGYEANPFVASSIGVAGYLPLIGLSYLLYRWMDNNRKEKVAIGIANTTTCIVAAQNLLLL